MIKDHNQKQEGAEKSTNLQAQSITVNQGLSYRDAKEIAEDVFKRNFLELSKVALEKAENRSNELINDFLARIEKEKPNAINSVESPSMQYALFSAQKEYAKTGDKELSDILVDLLVERADKEERSLIQIVLDESIEVSSKLTHPQFDVLSLAFLLKYTMNHSLGNLEKFKNYILTYLVPFCNNLTQENSCYQHLEYSKCASILVGPQIEEVFRDNYKGLFQKGHTKEQLFQNLGEYSNVPDLFIPCLRNQNLFQIKAYNDKQLDDLLETKDIPLGDKSKIKVLFSSNILSNNEIQDYIKSIHPKMELLVKVWNETMCQVNLTSVGVALARANIKRKTNIDLDLKIWIK